jgi:hypothetical protein
MDIGPFIYRVCADGMAAARESYSPIDQADTLRGAVEGFELCQGIEHADHLLEALHQANARAVEAMAEEATDQARWTTRVAKIEWVCDVVSAALVAHGLQSLGPLWPTGPAMIKTADLLTVRQGRLWRLRE